MSTYIFWSSNFILWIALLIGGFLAAGQLLQAQDDQPSSDDARKQILDLMRQMGGIHNSAQTRQSNPAGARSEPASRFRSPSSSNRKLFVDNDHVDLIVLFNEVAITFGITPLVVDPDIRGTVHIETATPMTEDDARSLFLIVLRHNNAALIKDKEVYKIVSTLDRHVFPAAQPNDGITAGRTSSSAKDTTDKSNQPPRLATCIVQSQFVPAKDLIEAIKPVMTDDGIISAFERLNILVWTDYSDSAARIMQIIHSQDIIPEAKGFPVIN